MKLKFRIKNPECWYLTKVKGEYFVSKERPNADYRCFYSEDAMNDFLKRNGFIEAVKPPKDDTGKVSDTPTT